MERLKFVNGMRFFSHPVMRNGRMTQKFSLLLTVKKFVIATRILLGGLS